MRPLTQILAWFFTAIFVAWGICTFSSAYPEKPNEVGDTLAGFASALAFIWIIAAYVQQNHSIQQQAEALIKQGEELANSNESLSLQIKELESTNALSALTSFEKFQEMTRSTFLRRCRQFIESSPLYTQEAKLKILGLDTNEFLEKFSSVVQSTRDRVQNRAFIDKCLEQPTHLDQFRENAIILRIMVSEWCSANRMFCQRFYMGNPIKSRKELSTLMADPLQMPVELDSFLTLVGARNSLKETDISHKCARLFDELNDVAKECKNNWVYSTEAYPISIRPVNVIQGLTKHEYQDVFPDQIS